MRTSMHMRGKIYQMAMVACVTGATFDHQNAFDLNVRARLTRPTTHRMCDREDLQHQLIMYTRPRRRPRLPMANQGHPSRSRIRNNVDIRLFLEVRARLHSISLH